MLAVWRINRKFATVKQVKQIILNIMKIRCFILLCLMVCMASAVRGADKLTLKSPNGMLELTFSVEDGRPYYWLSRDGKPVVGKSRMGFTMEWRDDLDHAFVLRDSERTTFDEVWQPVWGEEAHIRNHYNELIVRLEQPAGKVESMDGSTKSRPTLMNIRFRLYDDGLGFRYEFPLATVTPSATLWSISG